jgi:hypothetical protein
MPHFVLQITKKSETCIAGHKVQAMCIASNKKHELSINQHNLIG